MVKNIIISIDSFSDLNYEEKKEYNKLINDWVDNGRIVVFTARQDKRFKELTSDNFKWNEGVSYCNRDNLKAAIDSSEFKISSFVVVGNKDRDMTFAANNKLFFINPIWCRDIQNGANQYGLPIRTINGLKKLIKILENQNDWFFELEVDEKTTVLSLMSANDLGMHSDEERELIKGFREYLKKGNYRYYYILLYHFLAGISSREEFREIKDWAIFPSSGTELNPEMYSFKERARCLMNGKKIYPMFERKTPILKSHESRKYGFDRIPCDRHFDSIRINKKYKGKLKNRVVCVFDDYSTNGTSFEVVRNLLLREGVKKIYCVSLGRFGYERQPYYKQDYEINGDFFSGEDINYTLKSRNNISHQGKINRGAIKEIEKLYDIVFN